MTPKNPPVLASASLYLLLSLALCPAKRLGEDNLGVAGGGMRVNLPTGPRFHPVCPWLSPPSELFFFFFLGAHSHEYPLPDSHIQKYLKAASCYPSGLFAIHFRHLPSRHTRNWPLSAILILSVALLSFLSLLFIPFTCIPGGGQNPPAPAPRCNAVESQLIIIISPFSLRDLWPSFFFSQKFPRGGEPGKVPGIRSSVLFKNNCPTHSQARCGLLQAM